MEKKVNSSRQKLINDIKEFNNKVEQLKKELKDKYPNMLYEAKRDGHFVYFIINEELFTNYKSS